MFIFLLGRPGSGKSEIFRRLSKKIVAVGFAKKCLKLDDFSYLWTIFQEDERTGKWQRSRKIADGNYLVTDDSVWDDILCQLDSQTRVKAREGLYLFLEFARPNYRRAVRIFSPEVLNSAIILYVDCPFNECWRRNVERHKRAVLAGIDVHLVSREQMEKTYLNDDAEKLLKNPPCPAYRLDNRAAGFKRLNREIEKALKFIITQH